MGPLPYIPDVWACVPSSNVIYTVCICWPQSMDLDNPWIAQRKPWIHTLRDNPQIARAIHGSRVSKDAKYKFADNHGLRCVRKQLIAWFARRSSPMINYRSQV